MDWLFRFINSKPDPIKEKYRFIARFENHQDETNYIEWRDNNDIEDFYHESDSKTWPRDYEVTVVATSEKIGLIRNSCWFVSDLIPEMLNVQQKIVK
jgi:hypothetical protein